MDRRMAVDRACGVLLIVLTALVTLFEWGAPAALPTEAVAVAVIALLTLRAARRGLIFVAIGVAFTIAQFALRPLPAALTAINDSLLLAAFIAAFFTALGTLRRAADTSPAIVRCGRFLAQQPPGRRYGALTVGGQLFSLVLNYGAIALLGSLAVASAREEQNVEVRRIRIRRMLLAIQRGFISVLPWSPLSFAIAITTTLLPGSSWATGVLPCLVSGVLLAVIGYALDTIFKPKLTGPRPAPQQPEGGWSTVLPLLALLGLLIVIVGGLKAMVDVRVPGIVILVVPVISFAWVAMQAQTGKRLRHALGRARSYMFDDLPTYRGEITLLMMAGYIGISGADLLVPVVVATGADLSAIPAVVFLIGFVWLIPIAGQLGMNPIMAVSLVAPLIPPAAALGVTPTAILVAITSGWALSGASSPYTATTLLVGSFAGRSATWVGLRWNGLYSLICAVVLSLWVTLYAVLTNPA